MVNLILSPHFDDAVLSVGGLLAREGPNSVVASFFGGAPATPVLTEWDARAGFRDSSEATAARVLENQKALRFLGVAQKNIRNYCYLNRDYRGAPDLGAGRDELQESLARSISELLDEYSESQVRVFAPGLAMHPDHELVKQALLQVLNELPRRGVEYFLFQDLPYAYRFLNENAWNRTLLDQEIHSDRLALEAQLIVLSEGDIERKGRAGALYLSQIPPLEAMGENLIAEIKLYSVLQMQHLGAAFGYGEVVYRIESSGNQAISRTLAHVRACAPH